MLSQEVSEKLRVLRSPFYQTPVDKKDDKTWLYQARLNRFQEDTEIFERLRNANLRASAILDNKELDEAVSVLLEVRHKTMLAISTLASRSEYRDNESPDTRDFYEGLDGDAWGIYDGRYDPLGMKQLEALKLIESNLRPFIRKLSKLGQ